MRQTIGTLKRTHYTFIITRRMNSMRGSSSSHQSLYELIMQLDMCIITAIDRQMIAILKNRQRVCFKTMCRILNMNKLYDDTCSLVEHILPMETPSTREQLVMDMIREFRNFSRIYALSKPFLWTCPDTACSRKGVKSSRHSMDEIGKYHLRGRLRMTLHHSCNFQQFVSNHFVVFDSARLNIIGTSMQSFASVAVPIEHMREVLITFVKGLRRPNRCLVSKLSMDIIMRIFFHLNIRSFTGRQWGLSYMG